MEKPIIRITIRLDEETKALLDEFIAKNHLSVSEGIRMMIRYHYGIKPRVIGRKDLKEILAESDLKII